MIPTTLAKCSAILLALGLVSISQEAEAKRFRFRSSPRVVVVHTGGSSQTEQRDDARSRPKNPWAKNPAEASPSSNAGADGQEAPAKRSRGASLFVVVLAGIVGLVGIGWHLLRSSLRKAVEGSVGPTPDFEERLSAHLAELRTTSEPMLNGTPVSGGGFGRKSS